MNRIEELHMEFHEACERAVKEDPKLLDEIQAREQEYTKEESIKKILDFLRELRNADSTIQKIFLQGSCYRLYSILKIIYPEAEAFYSIYDGHWVTKISNEYYDINGRIIDKYIIEKGYEKKDAVTEASAYIPTHSNNIGTSYNKYAEI